MNEETKEMVDIVYGDPRLSKFRQEQRKARRERFTYGSQHLAKDKEIDAKLEQFSGDNALNFWMRKDNSKKSENLSNSKET